MAGRVLLPAKRINIRIVKIRGQHVIFDADLAELYGVSTKVLVQAVKRNGSPLSNFTT